MTAMKFLAVFDGNLTYRDTSGTGTLNPDTTAAYATSYWAGHQGLTSTASLASVANAANPLAGSAVVRFRTPADIAGFRVVFYLGTSSKPYLYLRLGATSSYDVQFLANDGTTRQVNAGVALAGNTDCFAYIEWQGATQKVAVEAGAPVALATHTLLTDYFPAAGKLSLGYGALNTALGGGRIDGLAIFDAPLTDAQRLYLRNQATPWTWGMALSAPIAGYIDVLPSPGANTGAPTLTLP